MFRDDLHELQLLKTDEYFLALGEHDNHTFIMLGVMMNGTPKLLARVGKAVDVTGCEAAVIQALGNGMLSRIQDERIIRKQDHVQSISYQAYSINYEQLKEFIRLIYELEKSQLENQDIQNGFLKKYLKEGEVAGNLIYQMSIGCYIPVSEGNADNNEDEVKFEFKKINYTNIAHPDRSEDEFPVQFDLPNKNMDHIFEGSKINLVGNTCRTTALSMMEAILGFVADVSEYYFVSPRYKTTLIAGQPNKDSFYIFPPPPNTVNTEKLSDSQIFTLNRLYARMEAIPQLNTCSKQTREKFDAIKWTYNKIAGKNHLSPERLLHKIQKYESEKHKALFERRGNFSKLFSLQSTTEATFCEIKKSLRI